MERAPEGPVPEHAASTPLHWGHVLRLFSKRERAVEPQVLDQSRLSIRKEHMDNINQQILSNTSTKMGSSSPAAAFLGQPSTQRLHDVFVSTGSRWRGVLFPTLNHSFRSAELEKLYQRYFARQRRNSLVMMNVTDCLTKLAVLLIYLLFTPALVVPLKSGMSGLLILFSSVLCLMVQAGKDAISHSYLQYIGLATWLYQTLQVLFNVGMGLESNEAWYTLYTVFGTYTMLPLPLLWSILAGTLSSLAHLLMEGLRYSGRPLFIHQIVVKVLLLVCMNISSLFISYLSDRAQRLAFVETRRSIDGRLQLEQENKRQEKLVLSMLPRFMVLEIINDMSEDIRKQEGFHKIYVHQYENVSIIFADIKGFTNLSLILAPQELVHLLDVLFGRFDELAEEHSCLRIKILGDCYYAVSGLPEPRDDHAHCCVKLGLGMIQTIRQIRMSLRSDIDMRIGIHSGFVLCGVLGLSKWQFDVWSLDVHIAGEMESSGEPGRVHISETTLNCLEGDYETEEGFGHQRSSFLAQYNIRTFFIKQELLSPSSDQRQFNFLEPSSMSPQFLHAHRETETILSSALHLDANLNRLLGSEEPWRLDHPFNKIIGLNKIVAALMNCSCREDDKAVPPAATFSRFTEVNLRVENAIELRSSDKLRAAYINELTLTFKDCDIERKYRRVRDDVFTSSVVCTFAMVLLTIAIQMMFSVPMPDTRLGHFAATLLIYGSLMCCTMAEGFDCLPRALHELSCWIQETYHVRTTVTLMAITANLIPCIYNMVWCPNLNPFAEIGYNVTSWNDPHQWRASICNHTELFMLVGVLSMVSCAIFLHLHSVVKMLSLTVIMAIYIYIAEVVLRNLIQENASTYNKWHRGIIFLLMFMFVIVVFYHGRQIEATARLDFLWRLLAKREMKEMAELRQHNENLLYNILPQHVAEHFLNRDPDDEELYFESHDSVGVLFASIPEFNAFYSQAESNQQGMECLTLLNEIIADFDELLSEERYEKIEKIKTIGSSYMAVSGLALTKEDSVDECQHLATLADLSLALENIMVQIYKHSSINFQLRVGFAHGPAVSGVIGATKPQFDIWGTTVNLASRMESTGISGMIQVPAETQEILALSGFTLQYRGAIYIKGVSETQGNVDTYLLMGRVRQVEKHQWMRRQSAQQSLSAFVSTLVQKKNFAISSIHELPK
ncbi:adenylate cyclase type 8-like isoform X2 [Narcine bancroftii]|uniref:adenylate cyclase type 8-like isoform X2 n=1 Tax=Narcine bancroftii TaxID=1343680 RepID=UPI0038319F33